MHSCGPFLQTYSLLSVRSPYPRLPVGLMVMTVITFGWTIPEPRISPKGREYHLQLTDVRLRPRKDAHVQESGALRAEPVLGRSRCSSQASAALPTV